MIGTREMITHKSISPVNRRKKTPENNNTK